MLKNPNTFMLKHHETYSKPSRHYFYQIRPLEKWLKHMILLQRKYTSKVLMHTTSIQQFQANYLARLMQLEVVFFLKLRRSKFFCQV